MTALASMESAWRNFSPSLTKLTSPFAGKTERAQKTALGGRLAGLRDRRFTLETSGGPVEVYFQMAGKQHRVARWRLSLVRRSGEDTSRYTDTPPETGQTSESAANACVYGDLGVPPSAPDAVPERVTEKDPADPRNEATQDEVQP